MSSRVREISVGTGMYLRHGGFGKFRVNGITPEGGPTRELHRRGPKI